jgi:hypothetical protein
MMTERSTRGPRERYLTEVAGTLFPPIQTACQVYKGMLFLRPVPRSHGKHGNATADLNARSLLERGAPIYDAAHPGLR